MSKPRSNADILYEFKQRATAAVATLEAQRDRAKKEMTGSAALTESAAENLFFAEAIAQRYFEAGARDDGSLFRKEGETDEDVIKKLRYHRRTLVRGLLFTPENMWPGFGALRQHYRREGTKRYLSETSFVTVEGDM